MAENGSLPSPTSERYRKPTSFPRLFTGLTTLKGFSESEVPVMSPTSILDVSKPFSVLKNPFCPDPNIHSRKIPEPETRRILVDSKGIGLGIVDALKDDNPDPRESKPVLFGSQLKVQIPASILSPQNSPRSPADFGIKTKCSFSSVSSSKPASGSDTSDSLPPVITGCLSATEMELSEDYTCVISHGPNPKTTHIFDNCIIESCCGVLGSSVFKKNKNGSTPNDHPNYQSESFLSYCYSCKKNLGQGNDIYIYRGEKSFCSRECRYQEMVLEEGVDKMESDDVYGSSS